MVRSLKTELNTIGGKMKKEYTRERKLPKKKFSARRKRQIKNIENDEKVYRAI